MQRFDAERRFYVFWLLAKTFFTEVLYADDTIFFSLTFSGLRCLGKAFGAQTV